MTARSVFFTLEDVPFVICDSFKPPVKVTLPLQFEVGNPSEILFMEYKTTLEETVLAQCSELQLPSVHTVVLTVASTSTDSVKAENTELSQVALLRTDICAEISNTKPLLREHSGLAFGIMNVDNILVPTQIVPSVSTWSREHSGVGKETLLPNIDLKDFENEQDPFENLSLRVMDDREELNKVFDTSESSQPPNPVSVGESVAVPTCKPELIKNCLCSRQLHHGGQNNVNDMSSSELHHISCQRATPHWLSANCKSAEITGTSIHTLQDTLVHHVDSQLSYHGIAASSSIDRMRNENSFDITERPVNQPSEPPTFALQLRSAKSTPDISSLMNECTVTVNTPRYSPPPPTHAGHGLLCTSNKIVVENKLLPEAHKASAVPHMCSSSAAEPSSIYLSSEAKHFVDSISAMGFDKTDVVRTVDKLGMDDKLVLDHLCQLARLKDKGHESGDSAMALFLFNNCFNKAEAYLKLSKNFTELGFPYDRIKDALIASNLDENKSLDLLIGT